MQYPDWTTGLSDSENRNRIGYEQKWFDMTGRLPCNDPYAVFALAQNPDGYSTQTTKENAAPTYTASSSQRLWVPQKARWATSREKLNSLLFPCFSEMARSAGVPMMQHHSLENAHFSVGNSMHVGVFIILHIALFSSIGLAPPASDPMEPEQPKPKKATQKETTELPAFHASSSEDLPPGVSLNSTKKKYQVQFDECDMYSFTVRQAALEFHTAATDYKASLSGMSVNELREVAAALKASAF